MALLFIILLYILFGWSQLPFLSLGKTHATQQIFLFDQNDIYVMLYFQQAESLLVSWCVSGIWMELTYLMKYQVKPKFSKLCLEMKAQKKKGIF